MAREPSMLSTSDDSFCPDCDYNLKGLTSDRCPSCGWWIDPEKLGGDGRSGHPALHAGIILSAMVVGLGSALGVSLLTSRGSALGLRDGLAALGVLLAAGGHVTLAVLMMIGGRRRSLRSRETLRGFCVIACISVLAGIAGATTRLGGLDPDASGEPKVVRGVVVTNVFEFMLAASLFSFPGLTLLVLGLISYRRAIGNRNVRDPGSGASGSARPDRAPFLVMLFGPYATNQLKVTASQARRPTSPSLERAIDQTWEAECSLAKADRRTLFDGKLGRLVSATANPGGMQLEMDRTTFREFVGTNIHNASMVLAWGDPSWLSNPLGTSATVISQDGFLLFGRRGERVAYHAGCLHTFGGMIEETDRRSDGGYDVVASIHRELFEELAVCQADVTACTIIGLAADRSWWQPELLFDVSVRLCRVELILRMDQAQDAHEHTTIESVRDQPDELLRFLDEAAPITPIAEAAMLLHGRCRWGVSWYKEAYLSRYGKLPPA